MCSSRATPIFPFSSDAICVRDSRTLPPTSSSAFRRLVPWQPAQGNILRGPWLFLFFSFSIFCCRINRHRPDFFTSYFFLPFLFLTTTCTCSMWSWSNYWRHAGQKWGRGDWRRLRRVTKFGSVWGGGGVSASGRDPESVAAALAGRVAEGIRRRRGRIVTVTHSVVLVVRQGQSFSPWPPARVGHCCAR